MSPSSSPPTHRVPSRSLALLGALTTAAVFALGSGAAGPELAFAHHRVGHEGGPTAASPQPTPTFVSPQQPLAAATTSTPALTETPLAEDERPG